MAVAAGGMVFVSLHELVPMARRYQQPTPLVGGLAASLLVYILISAIVIKA